MNVGAICSNEFYQQQPERVRSLAERAGAVALQDEAIAGADGGGKPPIPPTVEETVLKFFVDNFIETTLFGDPEESGIPAMETMI